MLRIYMITNGVAMKIANYSAPAILFWGVLQVAKE
jgi:hypothetical protein